jgi:hypothetical protein
MINARRILDSAVVKKDKGRYHFNEKGLKNGI